MLETKNILLNLLKVYNQSGHEKYISEIIKKWLIKNNIKFDIDCVGNIYNFNYTEAPFLNAHLDSVQTEKDKWSGKNLLMNNMIIYSPGNIIGGDDLVGVYIILYLLKYSKLKFNWILTVNEEVGATGSTHFAKENKEILEKSLYGIVIDRRGSGDILCSLNDYGTIELENDLCRIGKIYNYKQDLGTFSDCNTWRDYISCANLSCGYYEPHTNKEYIKLNEVFNTINYIKAILSNLNKRYEKAEKTHYGYYDKYVSSVYNRKSYNKNYYNYGEGYDDFDEEFYGEEYNDYIEDIYNKAKNKTQNKNIKKVCKFCGTMENNILETKILFLNNFDIHICESCAYDLMMDLEEQITVNYH
jgi:tripeptide aminopeptidase